MILIKQKIILAIVVVATLLIVYTLLNWATTSVKNDWKEYYEATQPKQYEAWRKHTGNPGNLTFEEWKYLPSRYK